MLDSVTAGDPPTVGDPSVRMRDCREPQNLVFAKFSLSGFGDNSRGVVLGFCFTGMRILFMNPRVISKNSSADVFAKYSPVASSQKPQKKNRYFTLQKTERFQEELLKN